jgi:pilus assembly protein CpaD
MRSSAFKQIIAASAGALALVLGGCGETVPPGTTVVDFQKQSRDVVKVEERHATQVVFVNSRTGSVSPAERERIARFVSDFGGDRPESVHVNLHGNGPTEQFTNVIDALVTLGLERNKIKLFPGERAGAAGARSDSIPMAATRTVAILPDCPGWLDHIAAPGDNQTEANFGCANVSNLGMMVADPADFAKGQSTPYSDAAPAVNAVQRYETDRVKPLPTTTNFSSTGSTGGAPASGGAGAAAGGGAGQ